MAYAVEVARWQPGSDSRLQQAALELYEERGFDRTTVADIAERAGLTERTFFRYFADKREVLFAGSEQLVELIVGGVAGAPAAAPAIEAVAAGIVAGGEMLQAREAHAHRRQAVIDASQDLQERELIKMSRIGTSITVALAARSVPEPAASLAAQAGIAVFRISFARWVHGPQGGPTLPDLMRDGFAELSAVAAPGRVPVAGAGASEPWARAGNL